LSHHYLDLRLDTFLERLAAVGHAPGGGSAAAITTAFSASLVAMAAHSVSSAWDEAAGIEAQAQALAERAAALAESDASAWEEAVAAVRSAEREGGEDARRDFGLEQALDRAAAAPLAIAELAADAAALAVTAGERCDATYRGDAVAAASLAAGAAAAAAHLVEVNLAVRPNDPRLAQAKGCAEAAADHAQRLLESVA